MSAQPENLRPQNTAPVRLVLPYPPSANRYWASRVIRAKATGKWMSMTYITPEARQYRDVVAKLALAAGMRPLTGRVYLGLKLYPRRPLDWARRARRDPDNWDDGVLCIDLGNCEKVLSDALNGVAWVDDKQHRRIEKERCEPDEHGARVEVTIVSLVRERVA